MKSNTQLDVEIAEFCQEIIGQLTVVKNSGRLVSQPFILSAHRDLPLRFKNGATVTMLVNDITITGYWHWPDGYVRVAARRMADAAWSEITKPDRTLPIGRRFICPEAGDTYDGPNDQGVSPALPGGPDRERTFLDSDRPGYGTDVLNA